MAVPLARKVVVDTNVFIDYLRGRRHAAWVFGKAENIVRFLSSVVLMELVIGASTPRRQRAVESIRRSFPDTRLIAPSTPVFERSAVVFRKLHGAGAGHTDRLGPMNDILIAASAWTIGAAVVTQNVAEFQRIQKHLPGLRIVAP